MKELVFSQNCLSVLTNRTRQNFRQNGRQSAEITINKPKPTSLPVFLMVTEDGSVQLPWLTNELNKVSRTISIEYEMVHYLNQAVFKTKNFKMFPILDFSNFQLCFETGLRCTLSEKNWIIYLTASQN